MNALEPISHAYLRNDLRNLLKALALVGGRGRAEYSEGYSDALAAVAVGLGMEPPVFVLAGAPRTQIEQRAAALQSRQ